MNNKGFAITTILYGTLIIFLMLIVSMLGILATYKDRLSLLIDSTNGARDIIDENACDSEDCAIASDGIIPVLDPGMIPVVIANDGTVTTVSECGDGWHSYTEEDKKWANVVLVTNDSRSNYLGTTGKKVNTSDILAYFVWIPRYKYKLWLTAPSGAQKGKEQLIEIAFENKESSKTSGSSLGDYMTHPAFIWGGEIISGFWFGKFETTGKADSGYTVLPNSRPAYSGLNIAAKVSGANSFASEENYGLNSSDSHVSLNSDWGAVAYLSHSKYGIGTKVQTNFKSFYEGNSTGCGANSSTTSYYSSGCQQQYGTKGSYSQSTTGNISGVFDMAGGTWEVVMGNNGGNVGQSGLSSMPSLKYFNQYGSDIGNCTLDMCGGHALYETQAWYSDTATFKYSNYYWFVRGSCHGDGKGIFSYAKVGGTSDETGWRTSIVVDS